jgi:hypothetical protein
MPHAEREGYIKTTMPHAERDEPAMPHAEREEYIKTTLTAAQLQPGHATPAT